MATFTYTANDTRGKNYTLRLVITEGAYTLVPLARTITYSYEISCQASYYESFTTARYLAMYGTGLDNTLLNVNNSYSTIQYGTKVIKSGSLVVPYSSDGTCQFVAEAIFETSTSQTYLPGRISIQQSVTLTPIPLHTIPNWGNMDIGTEYTVDITPNTAGWTHEVDFVCGTYASLGNLHETGNYLYTPPYAIINYLSASAVSAAMQITTRTYNGATLVGTASKTITLTVPNNATTKPTTGSQTLTEVNTQALLTGKTILVKDKSKIKCSLTPTPNYGATITGVTFVISFNGVAQGNPLVGVLNGSAYEVTSEILSNNGNVTVVANVTDSRGFTNTDTNTSKTVLNWAKPYVETATLSIDRNATTDTTVDCGFKVFTYSVVYSAAEINKINYRISRDTVSQVLKSDQTLSGIVAGIAANTFAESVAGNTATTVYEYSLKVWDELMDEGDAVPYTVTVSTAAIIVDMQKDRLAVGGANTTGANTFQSDWDMYVKYGEVYEKLYGVTIDTFTPVVVGATTAGTGTYSSQVGHYMKIGDMVMFTLDVVQTAHTGTGQIRINLPWTSVAGGVQSMTLLTNTLTLTTGHVAYAFVSPSTNYIAIGSSLTGNTSIVAVNMDATCSLRVSGILKIV